MDRGGPGALVSEPVHDPDRWFPRWLFVSGMIGADAGSPRYGDGRDRPSQMRARISSGILAVGGWHEPPARPAHPPSHARASRETRRPSPSRTAAVTACHILILSKPALEQSAERKSLIGQALRPSRPYSRVAIPSHRDRILLKAGAWRARPARPILENWNARARVAALRAIVTKPTESAAAAG